MKINDELLQKLIREVDELKMDKIEMKKEILELQNQCNNNTTEISELNQKMNIFESKINNLENLLNIVSSDAKTILGINKEQNEKFDTLLNKFVDATIENKKEETKGDIEIKKIETEGNIEIKKKKWEIILQICGGTGIIYLIAKGILAIWGIII